MTETIFSGLIDRLLAARNEPITPALLGDPKNGRLGTASPRWRAHMDAIDFALDLLIPAARELVMLETMGHGSSCVSKARVDQIVGRVPFDRKPRFR